MVSQVIEAQGRSFPDILHQSSQNADLIFLGMAKPGDNFTQYYENLQQELPIYPLLFLFLLLLVSPLGKFYLKVKIGHKIIMEQKTIHHLQGKSNPFASTE